MAKYKAEPNYSVKVGNGYVEFDHKGDYETTKQAEVKVLDEIDSAFVKKVDEPKTQPKETPKTEEQPKGKITSRKSGPRKQSSNK